MIDSGYAEYLALSPDEMEANCWYKIQIYRTGERATYCARHYTFEEFVDKLCDDREFNQKFCNDQLKNI